MSTTVKVERQGFEEDNIQQELELSEAKETDEVNLLHCKKERVILNILVISVALHFVANY